jgi:hypothetical protein
MKGFCVKNPKAPTVKREAEEDWGRQVIYPTLVIQLVIQLLHCNVECRRALPNKSVGFIIAGRKHANKIRASVTERRIALPPSWQ